MPANPLGKDLTSGRTLGALGALVGEHGARDLIASDPTRVTMVDVAEPPPMDIDTPGDYEELLKRRT